MKLEIVEVGQAGDGIALLDGERWFVAGTAPGDIVEAAPEKAGGRNAPRRARLTGLIEAGSGRTEPPCPHFGTCGGCALQHLNADFLQDWKRQRIVEALGRKGFENVPLTEGLAGGPGRRRRASFTALSFGKGRLALGFHERRGKRVIGIGPCPVLEPALEVLIGPLRDLMAGLLQPRTEARIQINLTDGGADVLIDGPVPDGLATHETLAGFAGANDLARLSLADPAGPRTIAERRPPVLDWSPLKVTPPPGAFLQADRQAERMMRETVAAWTSAAKRAVDLFAGVGTLTSALPSGPETLAVDADDAAMAALSRGVDAAPGVDLKTSARNLFRRPLMADELKRFDTAVLDPPAAGAREQAEQLAASKIGRIVYVSCAPPSFARDARILAGGGFRLVELRPIDQFYWSPDVELAALFTRG
ncbi:MAG: class I SAM-dependent RNA methyltransferase [Minwuia sp.]|uniref:class I SAM-dependent RNA methyltransferase n=1 Tax=Minwuia sp. TaxID=2493630 RepID=UPI003A8A1462